MKSKVFAGLFLFVLLVTLAPSSARAGSVALAGFVMNDPPTANLLSPAWVYSDFGTWLLNYNFGAAKLVINMTNLTALPSASDVARVASHPNYDRWWMVGYNEPDLNGITAKQEADRIAAQGNLILSVQPNARLSIASLSQYHPLGGQYAWKVWGKLPANIQARVKAFNVHFYVQSAGLPDASTFLAQPIEDYLDASRAAMVAHGVGGLELWITEIGLAHSAYTDAHPTEVANYPNVIAAAMNGRAERWAFYKQLATSAGDPYWTLMPFSPYPSLSAQGQAFKALAQ